MTKNTTNLDPNIHSEPKREIDLAAAYRIIISAWLLRQKPASQTTDKNREAALRKP